ncbi:hypothetical protein BaRGS_00025475 [Batillaria attramentaria]|uniref:Uncharacterized protein n=1 Tax=Batillaria attramentaria TaxID=370345 RepID=A0ABD0K8B3_9CAEN
MKTPENLPGSLTVLDITERGHISKVTDAFPTDGVADIHVKKASTRVQEKRVIMKEEKETEKQVITTAGPDLAARGSSKTFP